MFKFQYIQISMSILKTGLLFGLVLSSLAADCGPGGILHSNGTCYFPTYIEGCYSYGSANSCQDCQYNYVKNSKICTYMVPTDNSDCCRAFIQPSGECSECAPGLSLVGGKCIDRKIAGCLVKSKTGSCLNCALSYALLGGQCIRKTQGCKRYSSSGTCQVCQTNFDLAKGYCIPKTSAIKQDSCKYPWALVGEGLCQITGCTSYFDYGCSKCQSGFRLLPDGSCKKGQIEGCELYAPDGYCQSCKKPVYQQYSGFCIPLGCAKLNSEGKCSQCDVKNGFQMSNDGYCRIPNCLVSNQKSCLVCDKGFVQTFIGCQREDPRKVCITCARGFYLTQTGDCLPKQPGCLSYTRYKCSQCESNLYLNRDFKCIEKQPGCIYKDGKCLQCSFPYRRTSNQRCIIEGCSAFTEKGCKTCMQPYILSSIGTCTFQNCIEVVQGRCLSCNEGYSISHEGFCYKVDKYCKAYSLEGNCIECKLGYYFQKNGKSLVCKEEKFGCNYVDGRCTSCRAPFEYNPKEQTCEIDGCLKYFLGGCSTCAGGYDLRYNTCKLPFCLISHKGHCAQCDPNYVMKSDGTCVNKDQFCWKYDANGNCIQCAPEYFLSQITKKCLPRDPGCLYNDQDRCYACEKPFYFDGVRCQIYGCMKLAFKGCDQCFYPMEVTKFGLCNVVNCDRMEAQKCVACKPGFMLVGDGSCQKQDERCLVYGEKGCKKCIKGYKTDRNGICQYGDQHCWDFTQQGYCSNCDRLYFLNVYKKCQIKDSNCEAYSGGRCVQCKNFFYLYRGMCVANSKGCINQKGLKKCISCEDDYDLTDGICTQKFVVLDYNSIDMDFWGGDTDEMKAESSEIFSVGKTNKKNLDAVIAKGKGKIVYSSIANGRTSFQVDDYSDVNGWSPLKSAKGEYIGVILQNAEVIYAVDIKYIKGNSMTKFALEYSKDGSKFIKIGEYSVTKGTIDTVETFFFTPVETRMIRISVLQGQPNIKFQFYYGNGQYSSTSSSSSTTETYIQQQIQTTVVEELNGQVFNVKQGCVDKQLCWMGVELCQAKLINGVTLVPNKDSKGVIETVTIRYSLDGVKFECYNQCKEVSVNSNQIGLNPKVTATKLRVYPGRWSGDPSYSVTFDY